MLFLFENTLTHYIYIVFYTLISRARLARNLGNFYAMSRHATPSPRSEQLHAMSTHAPNGIRTHNNRHTIANEPGNLHTNEQPHPNGIRAYKLNSFREADGRTLAPSGMPHALSRAPSVPSRTPSPARVCVRIYLQVSPYPHHTKGLQSGGCPFLVEVCSKSQFALTVRNIPCFLGFDLRIAAFGKFSF